MLFGFLDHRSYNPDLALDDFFSWKSKTVNKLEQHENSYAFGTIQTILEQYPPNHTRKRLHYAPTIAETSI